MLSWMLVKDNTNLKASHIELFPEMFLKSGHTWSFKLFQTMNTAITNTEESHKSVPKARRYLDNKTTLQPF